MKIKIKKTSALISIVLSTWLMYNSIHALYTGTNASGHKLSDLMIALQIISLIIFGFLWLVSLLKLTDTNAIVEFDEEGIKFRPDRIQKANVSWNDIVRIDYNKVRRRKVIVPILKYPEDIIAQQTNWFGRSLMKTNLKRMGSPIVINMENYSTDFAAIKNYLDTKNLKTIDTSAQS